MTANSPAPSPQPPTPNPQRPTPYPLLLKPEFHARVWGGRRLAAVLGAALPDGAIGESWSMGSDNRVLNGPLAGQTVGALVAGDPDGMLGRMGRGEGRTDLPLLFKIIDANDLLSIQVHPDDRYARDVEHAAYGKTEAWYALDAAPGATVIHGFRRPVNPDEVRAGLADGGIVNLVRHVSLQAGDAVQVPAGTVHAIGGGLLLGEIQENSDITYRLYDWGRPRELHIEQSLAVLNPNPPGFGPSTPLDVRDGESTVRTLAACRYYVYQALEVQGRLAGDTAGRSLAVLFCYGGSVLLRWGSASLRLGPGQTVFVPAALGAYTLEGEAARLLRAFVPDLRVDVIQPLLAADYSAAQISALGGPPGNEVERLLAPPAHA